MVVAAGERPLSPVQLQKTLFLIGKNLKDTPESFYDFEPYHYGPFDAEVYSDAGDLEDEGLVLTVHSTSANWADRAITPSGLDRVAELKEDLPPHVPKYVDAVVKWAQSLSFSSLVRAIYEHYPEYRENSVFRG